MPRRSRRTLLDDVLELPWWVSVVAAAIAYLIVGVAIPWLFSGSTRTVELGNAARTYGWIFALAFLLPAPFAAVRRHRRKKLLDAQADLVTIRNLHWQEFEKLVAEAFNRIGYAVTEAGGSSAEGGVDLVATAPNEKILVQCKHWRAAMVGVSTIGELFGVMTAESATGGAVVTSGTFSPDAVTFAAGKSIQLIDGTQLEKLVLSVRIAPSHEKETSNDAR